MKRFGSQLPRVFALFAMTTLVSGACDAGGISDAGGEQKSVVVSPDTADITVDFDHYDSTAQLLQDCATFHCVEDVNTHDITLVTDTVAPGHTKSMRYKFMHPDDGCGPTTVEREIRFPQPVQEVWAEFVFKYSTNFTTTNNTCPPNDHKLIFGDTKAPLNGRWGFKIGSDIGPYHTIRISRPYPFRGEELKPNQGSPSPLTLWRSNQWLTVRFHLKASTTASSNDGVLEVWLTNPATGKIELIHRLTGFSISYSDGVTPDRIQGFSFTHNMDDGPPNVDMYIWWGQIRFWMNSPDWYTGPPM